ncbi:MAG: aldo/keto reductase, partial [bacterium]
EVLLGFALRGVPRDSYVLSTKLGRYDLATFDFRAARVVESVEVSLKRLGTDHLDLVFCHDVEFVDLAGIASETLPALRKLQREGKVRFVGVAGYPLKIFREILTRTELDVILSYSHYTLQNTTLAELLPLFAARGTGVLNAAPWAMRLLTNEGPPQWHKADPELRGLCAKAAALCRARGSSLAKLALQFAAHRPEIASTICGTANPARIPEWTRWLAEPFDEALAADVRALLAPARDRAYVEGLPENNE